MLRRIVVSISNIMNRLWPCIVAATNERSELKHESIEVVHLVIVKISPSDKFHFLWN